MHIKSQGKRFKISEGSQVKITFFKKNVRCIRIGG